MSKKPKTSKTASTFQKLKHSPMTWLLIRFGVVGGIGFMVNFTVLSLFQRAFGFEKFYAEFLAIIGALQVTFLFHDKWTYSHFNKRGYGNGFKKRYFSYLITNSVGSLMTLALFWLFSLFINQQLIALGMSAVIAMVWNFIINKIFIWRDKIKLDQGIDASNQPEGVL